MTIRLTFHGAARAVTGSCVRLETPRGAILIDCGMFQGSKTEKELNYRDFPFSPGSIAAVVLSHAHIDHSGLLPKLGKHGFKGPIFATPATGDLAAVMLPDSAYIQEMEVAQLNRRNARRNRKGVEPIYDTQDAERCLSQFRAEPYGHWFTVIEGVRARFWNAGHLLGSASVELEVSDEGGKEPQRILFSADIGPDSKLLQPDPEGPSGIDYLICESTYGGTEREDADAHQRRRLLRDEVRAAIRPSGALLIPSFAVERAQELVSDLVQLMEENELPRIPVFVDSPLATRASEVFARHARDLEHGAAVVRRFDAHNVHFTESAEQSRALDRQRDFHIVIAASGMCEAGRIRHRLKNWIWREEATVLIVGYQAQGTLGRIMQDGASSVRIQGEEYDVRARIRTIDLYSGHADARELVEWVRARLPVRHETFLVHGEQEAMEAFRTRLGEILPAEHIILPSLDETYELTPEGCRRIGAAPRIAPDAPGRLDWHNDVSKLILDINAGLAAQPDEKTRAVLIRRLRRALEA